MRPIVHWKTPWLRRLTIVIFACPLLIASLFLGAYVGAKEYVGEAASALVTAWRGR